MMCSIPHEIAWAERDKFMAGMEALFDQERFQKAVKKFLSELAYQIDEEIEYNIQDHATLNAADSIRDAAERMAVEMLTRILHGDEDAFLHLVASTPFVRQEGREKYPLGSGKQFREAIFVKHAGLFVSEILADRDAQIESMQREIDRLRYRLECSR